MRARFAPRAIMSASSSVSCEDDNRSARHLSLVMPSRLIACATVLDATVEAERIGVDRRQQPERQRWVAADDLLDLFDVDRSIQRRSEFGRRRPAGSASRSSEDLGLGEVVALEQVETELDAAVEVVDGLDLLGDHEHTRRPFAGDSDQSFDLGVMRSRQFDLDDAGQREQLGVFEIAEPTHVVEREVVAVVARLEERCDRGAVERFDLSDLDDHPFGRHREVQAVDDRARAGVDQSEPVPDDMFHAPLENDTLHDPTRCGVGVVEGGCLVGAAAVQQLESEDLSVGVDDRLSPEEHL